MHQLSLRLPFRVFYPGFGFDMKESSPQCNRGRALLVSQAFQLSAHFYSHLSTGLSLFSEKSFSRNLSSFAAGSSRNSIFSHSLRTFLFYQLAVIPSTMQFINLTQLLTVALMVSVPLAQAAPVSLMNLLHVHKLINHRSIQTLLWQ